MEKQGPRGWLLVPEWYLLQLTYKGGVSYDDRFLTAYLEGGSIELRTMGISVRWYERPSVEPGAWDVGQASQRGALRRSGGLSVTYREFIGSTSEVDQTWVDLVGSRS